jgi:hypothetical protein
MKIQKSVWQGIQVKSTSIDPRYDLWHKAFIIGFNPFTNKMIVCDENGNLVNSVEVRNLDNSTLSMAQYKAIRTEIKIANERALYEVRNEGISSY